MKIQTISIVTAATILLVGCGKQSGSSGTASAPAKEQSSAESAATAADALRVSPSPLELVLNFQKLMTVGTNVFLLDRVEFSTATNVSMEVSFRNVGENWMRPNDLPLGLSIILDGKAYKLTHPEHFFMYDGPPFQPKIGWSRSFPLSEFVVPLEALTPGRHTVAVRDELSETNTFTGSGWQHAVFSKSNRQIFAESSTLTVFIMTPK